MLSTVRQQNIDDGWRGLELHAVLDGLAHDYLLGSTAPLSSPKTEESNATLPNVPPLIQASHALARTLGAVRHRRELKTWAPQPERYRGSEPLRPNELDRYASRG